MKYGYLCAREHARAAVYYATMRQPVSGSIADNEKFYVAMFRALSYDIQYEIHIEVQERLDVFCEKVDDFLEEHPLAKNNP